MPKYSYEQFSAVRNYAELSFSLDCKWLAYILLSISLAVKKPATFLSSVTKTIP